MATEPPFRPGDVVRTRYYSGEVNIDRTVARCFQVGGVWNVEVRVRPACECCRREFLEVPILPAEWFSLWRKNDGN